MSDFDESDQAAIVGTVMGLHLERHKENKPDPNCPFCRAFLIDNHAIDYDYPLESYKFVILDLSDDEK